MSSEAGSAREERGTKVALDLGDKVVVRKKVPEYGNLEGEVNGIERDMHGFPTYWVYLYKLTATVKFQRYELREAV